MSVQKGGGPCAPLCQVWNGTLDHSRQPSRAMEAAPSSWLPHPTLFSKEGALQVVPVTHNGESQAPSPTWESLRLKVQAQQGQACALWVQSPP